jgi:dethiobiotin synthetase
MLTYLSLRLTIEEEVMTKHFWIVGTDIDVGKTLVTTYFMRYFQTKGITAIPYKPIQTGINVQKENNI